MRSDFLSVIPPLFRLVMLGGVFLCTESLSEKDRGLPPGCWEFYPNRLIAGEETIAELRYSNGAKALAPGAKFRFRFEGISVQKLQHTPISTDFNLVPYRNPLPAAKLGVGPVDGLGCQTISVVLEEGLEPFAGFALRFGNLLEDGEIRAKVNPTPVNDLSFNVFSDTSGEGAEVGWFEQGWWSALPRVDIEGGPPSALRLFGPSLVEVSKPFELKVAVNDSFDNAAWPPYAGSVMLSSEEAIKNLSTFLLFDATDNNSRRIEGIRIATPGIYRIEGRLAESDQSFKSNPIVVREQVDEPIYWGLLHGHDIYSECWGDGPRNYYRFGRDISGLDFLALSDHYGQVPNENDFSGRLHPYRFGRRIPSLEAFLDTMDAADEFHEPGKFVALAGYEWSSEQSGHHNIYLANITRENYRQLFTEQYVDLAYEMRSVLEQTEALFIPHTHAWFFPYSELKVGRTVSGQPLSPVVEAYSDWGMSFHPPSTPDTGLLGHLTAVEGICYREAVARGLDAGLISDSDTHTGLPGRRHAGNIAPAHDHPQGITAVRMNNLTRQGLVSAYRERKTYGTSGERIFLEMHAGDACMGETFRTDDPFEISIMVAGTDAIESVGLYDGQDMIELVEMDGSWEGQVRFELSAPGASRKPYFVEVVQANGHRAWSSPLWVERASMAELVWESDNEGRLWLVNRGTAAARNIEVFHDAEEYPFVRPSIAPKPNGSETRGGLFWTRRIDDRQSTVFFRWKGEPIEGTVRIEGFADYRVDKSIRMLWFSTVNDHGDGTIDFTGHQGEFDRSVRPGPPKHEGFDLTITASSDRPCLVEYEFDRPIEAWIGKDKHESQSVVIHVNGLESESPGNVRRVESLSTGERWQALQKDGYWCVDPNDRIAERSESNNMHVSGK